MQPPHVVTHADAAPDAPRKYDGALVCGIGASLGAVGGAVAVSAAAYLTVPVAAIAVGGDQTATTILLGVTLALIPLGSVVGAAAGAAYGGDRDHQMASAVAGGIGVVAATAAATVTALGGFAIVQSVPPASSPVAAVGIGMAEVAATAATFVATAGVTAAMLAPVLAGDAP